jgi:hypothetical protein
MGVKMGLFFKMQGVTRFYLRRRWKMTSVRIPKRAYLGISNARSNPFFNNRNK